MKRELGLLDAVAVGWGAIVGAGIFVVIGIGAELAGPALLVSLLLAATVASCNALSAARLAARFPKSGGTYEYASELLHPWAGFAAGWMFVVSKTAAGAAVALGIGAYAAPTVPAPWGALGALGLLTGANLMGIRKVGRLNLGIVAITLGSLIVFSLWGLSAFEPTNLVPFAPNGPVAVLHAAAVLFFAFTGYARVATLAEEVKEPETTIPKAVTMAILSATGLYVLVAAAALGSVGAALLAESEKPLRAAAQSFGGSPAAGLVTFAGLTAMLGVVLSQVLGISRVLLAMGRRGDMPSAMARIGARGVPSVAVPLTGLAMAGLALWGNLGAVVECAAFTILLYYAITNLAALRLPGSRSVAWLGLAACCGLALSLSPATLLAGLAVLGIGLLWRAVWRRGR